MSLSTRACLLSLALSASNVVGCAAKPTSTECEAFADHIIDLAARTANEVEVEVEVEVAAKRAHTAGMADPVRARGEARRAELIDRCVASPRPAFECAMAADSLSALRACKR